MRIPHTLKPAVTAAVLALCVESCTAVRSSTLPDNTPICRAEPRDEASAEELPQWFDEEFRSYLRRTYPYPVVEMQLLCWQQIRGRWEQYQAEEKLYRNFYVALVWLRLDDNGTTRWSHAFVWNRTGQWEIPSVPGIHELARIYNHPPTSADLYSGNAFAWFFEPHQAISHIRRSILDGAMRKATWRALTGGDPLRPFPTSGKSFGIPDE